MFISIGAPPISMPTSFLRDLLSGDSLQRFPADEIRCLVQVDEALEPDLVRIVVERHVDAVVEDAGLDAADVGRPVGAML